MSQPLSPAAQAVDRAIADRIQLLGEIATSKQIAAAVLRAVADQVVPEAAEAVGDQHDEARRDQWLRIRWKLLALAAELEGFNG